MKTKVFLLILGVLCFILWGCGISREEGDHRSREVSESMENRGGTDKTDNTEGAEQFREDGPEAAESASEKEPFPGKETWDMEPVIKKGVASSRYGNGIGVHLRKLEEVGAGWYYNWGSTGPWDETDMEFVPMIWGLGNVNGTELGKVAKGFAEGKYHNLLTFNEPDMGGEAGGCSMTVEQALEAWPRLEELGIRLSSPAVAADYDWLRRFMEGCEEKGYRVDFLAVHCYQDVTDDNSVGNLRKLLLDLYDTYGRPLWLTEFGCIDISTWSGSENPDYTMEASAKYLEECTAMLEKLGFVERYSFFLDNYGGGANPPEGRYSRLYDDNDEINLIGETYRDILSGCALRLVNESLDMALTGETYYVKLEAEGGQPPYSFTASGLPKGLSLDEKSGELEGVYEKGGARVAIVVTDANGQFTRKIYDIKDRRQ